MTAPGTVGPSTAIDDTGSRLVTAAEQDVEVIASRPPHVQVPETVQALIAGRPYAVVWKNERDGLTFEVRTIGGGREFIKWAPAGSGIDLMTEVVRLTWASSLIRVPRVIDSGIGVDGAWMVTAGLPGDNAVSPPWSADPKTAVTAIGEGLRVLHETLIVEHCPFTWSTGERIADAQHRARTGHLEPINWHVEHQNLSAAGALRAVADPPPIDHLVVCHGDACAPNTLIDRNGRWSGHVDLGALGIADRWADLAVATWSTQWNYGPGWEQHLLAAYGVNPDPERTAYYRLLWELGP